MSNLQSSLSSGVVLDVLKVPLNLNNSAVTSSNIKVKRRLQVKPVVQMQMIFASTCLSFKTVQHSRPRRVSRMNRMWRTIKLL